MAERSLAAFLTFLSLPITWLARSAEAWNACGICADIEKCIDVVDSQRELLPKPFIVSLIAAEDHRNAIHPGVDPISILRAVYVRWRCGVVQGASTVEQQFVRVVSGRYERTLTRKLYEQALAICVSRRRTKVQIAKCVSNGCLLRFGNRWHRWSCGQDLERTCARLMPVPIRAMIARLKYPEPSRPTETWRTRVGARVAYIERRAVWLERADPLSEVGVPAPVSVYPA